MRSYSLTVPYTELTFSSDQQLSLFAVGDAITEEPGGNASSGSGVGSVSTWQASSMDVTKDANWSVGKLSVQGPVKALDSTRKYLQFNSAGQVIDLISAPQDPAYTTTDPSPGLTFQFCATFLCSAPDDELADGVTLTATVRSTNTTADVTSSANVTPT